MRYDPIQNSFFSQNRERLMALMPENSMAVMKSAEKMPRNGDQFFPFRQQSDFFYLTGIESDNCSLILFPDCPVKELRQVLFIEAYNAIKATWDGHMLSADEAKEIAGIETVRTTDQFEAVMRELMNYARAVYLNLNEYPKFSTEVPMAQQRFAASIRKQYPLHTYLRMAPLLEGLRVRKSQTEVSLLQKACDITGLAFNKVMQQTRPGRYEYEIQAEIEYVFTNQRANGHGYYPIVAGGANSCTLHYSANDQLLQDGDLLLLDFGAEYANYSADLSRTIPVNGKFSKRQRACYDAVLRVFKEAVKLYVPGSTIDQINKAVWEMMEKEMIGLGLFTADEVKKQKPENPLYRKYLMHGVAHHIGLDVHDVGLKHTPLAPGMILTCEPGIYIREEKIGIRIENDILVTEGDPVDLMARIPIEAEEIEAIMNQ